MGADPSHVKTVAAAYSAFARGDIDRLLELLSDRVLWDATDALWQRGMYVGHDGVRDYFRGLGGMWAELRLEDYEIEPAGPGSFLAHGRLRGRARATGEVADSPFTHWLEVGADGKVARLEIIVHEDRRNA